MINESISIYIYFLTYYTKSFLWIRATVNCPCFFCIILTFVIIFLRCGKSTYFQSHVDNYICEDFFSRLFLFNCIQISKISSSPFYYRFCFVMDMKCTKNAFHKFSWKNCFYFTKILFFSLFLSRQIILAVNGLFSKLNF